MKAISIIGFPKSGKTTVCEIITSGLCNRGYTVGSIKDIQSDFVFDYNPTSNKQKLEDAQQVTIRSLSETDILYQSMLPVNLILKHYDQDFVILEDIVECNAPRIITAISEQDILELTDNLVIAVSGIFANQHDGEINGLPIFNALEHSDSLVDFVIENAFEPLPNFDAECCSACGYSCREMAELIAHHKALHSDCILSNQRVELLINDKPIKMVPFVQNILRNAVMGVVSELQGYAKNSNIKVRFKL